MTLTGGRAVIRFEPPGVIADALGLKQQSGGRKYIGPCPLHGGDNKAGMTLLDGGDRPHITCHTAGCDWGTIIFPWLMDHGLAHIDKADWVPNEEYRRRQREARQAAEDRQRERREQDASAWLDAAARAREIWGKSGSVKPDHPYLAAKGVHGGYIRQYRTALAIPVCFNRQLVNLQFIGPDGSKKFLKRAQTKACYHPIDGQRDKPAILCEGWATGMSLSAATHWPVICALSTTNMALAGLHVRDNNPDMTLIIAADNGEAGHRAADKAAGVLGCGVVFPNKQYGDFNDEFNATGCAGGFNEPRF